MKKKLLFLVSHVSFFISHRLEIAISAYKEGYDVSVAYGDKDADIKILYKNNISCYYLPIERGGKNIFKDIKSLFAIWKIFKKIKPTIVHLVTIKPYLYGGILARILKIPCVVIAISGLGSLFINQNLKSRFLRIFLYPFYKFAFNHFNQKVIVQNKQDAKLLLNWGVLNPNKVFLIKGSGVDLKKFFNLKETSGIPKVCFIARLLHDKGINEFVEAANLLVKKNIEAKFYIAGNIDVKNPTSLSINDLEILKKNKNVQILGYRKNIISLLANAHVICLPSYREGLPKILIEAAAASRAIITTNVPGCKDAIIPNKTGILVPRGNSKKLAEAIQWLVNNPRDRILMGRAGRKFAEKNFKIEFIIQHHLDIYKKLINNNKKTQH